MGKIADLLSNFKALEVDFSQVIKILVQLLMNKGFLLRT